ncbi:hypothetical protein WBP07_12455 [Novosphingobium sp. BL-8A]
MKPLILGMGPCRSYPSDAWHPEALSTANLSRLIMGSTAKWPMVEHHFDLSDLNKRWYRVEGAGDAILPDEAEATLRALVASGGLRGGRKAFLLGEQVTDFVFSFLRRPDHVLAANAWRTLPKGIGVRLRTSDPEARIGAMSGFYDFLAIPVWHPRILLDSEIRMPPGWQQKMMTVMRAAAGLPPMKFSLKAR